MSKYCTKNQSDIRNNLNKNRWRKEKPICHRILKYLICPKMHCIIKWEKKFERCFKKRNKKQKAKERIFFFFFGDLSVSNTSCHIAGKVSKNEKSEFFCFWSNIIYLCTYAYSSICLFMHMIFITLSKLPMTITAILLPLLKGIFIQEFTQSSFSLSKIMVCTGQVHRQFDW